MGMVSHHSGVLSLGQPGTQRAVIPAAAALLPRALCMAVLAAGARREAAAGQRLLPTFPSKAHHRQLPSPTLHPACALAGRAYGGQNFICFRLFSPFILV